MHDTTFSVPIQYQIYSNYTKLITYSLLVSCHLFTMNLILWLTAVLLFLLVVCDIGIFISIRYRYDNRANIEISIRFLIIFNCVGGVIAWVADIYKYASNTIYTAKLLHRTNRKTGRQAFKVARLYRTNLHF